MGDHFYSLTRKTIIYQNFFFISNKKSECNHFLNWGKLLKYNFKKKLIEKLEAICWKCTFRTKDNISFKNLLYNQIFDLENSIWCNFARFCLQLLTLNSLINEHDCLAFFGILIHHISFNKWQNFTHNSYFSCDKWKNLPSKLFYSSLFV